MDIEPWVVALVGFVVVSVIVIIVSMFSIRETPFEEAVASRHQGLDLALDPSFSGKRQKDKNKDKSKDKSSKKPKEVKVVKPAKNSTEPEFDKKNDEKKTLVVEVNPQQSTVVTSVPAPPVSVPVIEIKPAAKCSKNDGKKHDHIEFKVSNEVVTLNEEEDQKLSERRVSRDDRPRKPILIKKSPAEAEVVEETKVVRGNSFETVHPKDEFELVKSKQLKQCEVVDGQVNGHAPEKLNQPVNALIQPHKKHKNKTPPSAESTQILTSKQLIETVKSLALSDEEVQLVVNELLNKQSENTGDSNWSSKNDPVAHLKKSLAEKEQALATESCNLQAAQARLRELRQEFATEKTRNASIQQTGERLRLEIQRQQLVIQQLTERHEVEVKTLQTNLQAKLNDERSLAMAREEIKRLKELIKKLEAERSSLDSIPRLNHEIEQLRSERSQSDRTIASLKSNYEESQRRAAMLDEHLQKLVSDRTQEESAREQQVKDLRNQMQASESKVHSLLEELKALQNSKREEEGRKSQVDQRIKQLELQVQSLESENGALKSSLSKSGAESSQQLNELKKLEENLRNEIQSRNETNSRLEKELEEERTYRGNSESERESRLKALNDDLSRIESEKEQATNTVSELQVQNDKLNREKDEAMDLLRPLNLAGGDEKNLVSLVKCLANQLEGILGVDISQLEKEKQLLTDQVDSFKQNISRKEEALKEIQSQSEEEKKSWEEKLKQIVTEKELVEKDRERLSVEKKSLENTLKDLEGLQSTVIEMEEKLRDLQSKLESEELTKKELSTKYDEVRVEPEAASNLANLREQVEAQSKELEQVTEEKQRLVQLKEEMDATSEQLEKDKKSVKEVQVQNVRLKSLVKIGEDSLKAEQERVRQLEELLSVKNGSVANQVNMTSNGDGSISPKNASSPSLNQESVS